MKTTISISEELFKAIQKNAVPFKDHEPADVLIRWATQLGKMKESNPSSSITTSTGSYINKTIHKFFINGKEFSTKNWTDFQVKVCEELFMLYPSDFYKCLRLSGRKMNYFSKNVNELKAPKPISDSGYFVETYLNNDYKVKRLKELMKLLRHDENDLIIEIK